MAVAVTPSSSGLSFGVPRALFRIPARHGMGATGRTYAPSRDGRRFLALDWPREAAASPIAVVLGPPATVAAKP